MTVTPFTLAIGLQPANAPHVFGPITAGAATEFALLILLDLPNGLADWKSNAAYAGLQVTLSVEHDEDGSGFIPMSRRTFTAPTDPLNHLPAMNVAWNPTSPTARARATVTFSAAVQAGAHGSITTTP